MEILNKNGMILMDYRREFKRHYADSVDEALKEAILTLYREGQIPEKLFRIILDDTVDDSVVYTYLLSRREFTKSSMELNSEFNEVREKVNDYLIKINFVKNVCTKNSVNTNRIYIIKQYDIPKELLLSYFGLTPAEIIPLMKRKGFMDKFCVLRLSQAFKEIYSELKVPEHIDHGYSLIYYNKLIQGFSIDYKYMVSVNYINDPERLKDIVNKIRDLDGVVQKQFESKMSYSYFHQLDKKMNIAELAAEIEKIVIPVRSGKRAQDIRRPELVIDEVTPAVKPNAASVSAIPKIETNARPNMARTPILVVDEGDGHAAPKSVPKPEEIHQKKEQKPAQPQPKQEVKHDVKSETKPAEKKPENKPVENKPEVKPENKPADKKSEPKPEGKKPENNQQKNNQQNPGNQNGKPQNNQGNKQPNNNQQKNNGNQPRNDNKPQQNQGGKPAEVKEPIKPENKKPDNQPKPNQKEQKPVQQPPKQEPKPQSKPAVIDDDDDDLLGEVISAPVKPVKNDKPAGDKPMLVVDDSDLDLI